MTASSPPSGQAPIIENGPLRLRRCRHGVMLYNLNDIYVGRMLDRYGEFSEEENDVFSQVLKPGMTVVEAGANIGAHTVSLAHLAGPHGRVLAFEPQRSIFQILCANLALNGIEQVEAHRAGVGSKPGFITVPHLDSNSRQNFAGLMLGDAREGDRVRLVTLDEFDLPDCALIKIDVEGMEADVIRGARETIRRHRPVIYTENDREKNSAELIALVQELDYRCFWHMPPYVRIPNFRGVAENDFPDMISINMVCVPRRGNVAVNGLREVAGPEDSWRLA